jgi:hypothetical protein
MNQHGLYFVGSMALPNAEEVFRTLGSQVGRWMRWMPDGETGPHNWIMRFAPVFAAHKDLQPTDLMYRRDRSETTNIQYQLKPGVAIEDVRFDDLPTTRIALDSYALFAKLKSEGAIPAHVRFQVTIAGINSIVRRFIVAEQQEAMMGRFEAGLIEQVKQLAEKIPRDQLAIQWDIASAVFQYLEVGKPTRFGKTSEEMAETFAVMHARLVNAVPEGVDVLLHLCYGDANHRHSIEPNTMQWLVLFTNRLLVHAKRPVQLIHMPVPRNRTDDAYFAPLKDLKLPKETTLALGLVHHTDGVDGTRRRMETADRYVKDYMLATECGLGRRPPETIPELLNIHKKVSGHA